MKIFFSGGGTLGSVTPLIAMQEIFKKNIPNLISVWIGTKKGPERALVEAYSIPFIAISSGKIRRYSSWSNLSDLIKVAAGFWQSFFILRRERPDVCISAGGFVSVPLHLAARLLHIPTWIHQQDVSVGLANRSMAQAADAITTALKKSIDDFPKKSRVWWIGNPVRADILVYNESGAREHFGILSTLPIVLVLGGGTGSVRVNGLILEALQYLQGVCEVIHLTGSDRPQEEVARTQELFSHYHPYRFLVGDMKYAYSLADLVVTRGGFGTLSEIAAMQKAAIVIPKGGHQEENATYLAESGAVEIINEVSGDGLKLQKMIVELLQNQGRRSGMGQKLAAVLPRAREEEVMRILHLIIQK